MNFDLNINNYTKKELIEIFDLQINFNNTIIENKTYKIIDNILKDNNINEYTKKLTISFLKKAKNIILYNEKNGENNELYKNIIQKKEIPYIYSFPNEYVQGDINQLKKRTIIQNLNIDSRFRDNYYTSSSSNFNITLPLKLHNIIQMQLISIELPKVYYSISSQYNNNNFIIIVNDERKKISIPFGNYNADNIMIAINTVLENIGEPFKYVSFSTEQNTLKTIININDSDKINSVSLIFYEIDNDNVCIPIISQQTLGWLLGFRQYVYSNNLYYTSDSIIDLSGSKYLYLVIDDFNNNVNNNFMGAFKSSILNNNIISRISIKSNDDNILVNDEFNIISPYREYFGPVNILLMNIQLLDEYGRQIDLNNMNFNFCLSLLSIYDL
jgi:hypothetical protein